MVCVSGKTVENVDRECKGATRLHVETVCMGWDGCMGVRVLNSGRRKGARKAPVVELW